MDIGFQALNTTLLLMPGIFWSLIWMKYSRTKPIVDKFYFLVYSLIASAICYGVMILFNKSLVTVLFNGYQSIAAENARDIVWCVFYASIIATALGIAAVFCSHRRYLVRFMNWLGLTKDYGEEDLWGNFLKKRMSQLNDACYVAINDYEKEFIYFGKVETISESGKLREVVLSDAKIYDFSGNLKHATKDFIYFSGKSEYIHIEFFNNDKLKKNKGNKDAE